ncbi:uncharacterized protein LOC117124453 [Anneissia japonica]|uniref:uncharacterized protein LOC117124453 n=1 Tax=Anneissia japonica TaxID=1529436 RepID=UPI001425845D|nr:uncharacterized protein LOC117124453 [Anneissia japonica]
MAEKKKRVVWREGEVKDLIAIWGSPEFRDRIEVKNWKSSTSGQKMLVFEDVAATLHSFGHPRKDGHNIQTKIKGLRSSYKAINDKIIRSGSGTDCLEDFPYFDSINEILGHRPNICPPERTVGDSFGPAFHLSNPNTTRPRPRPSSSRSRPSPTSSPCPGTSSSAKENGLEEWYANDDDEEIQSSLNNDVDYSPANFGAVNNEEEGSDVILEVQEIPDEPFEIDQTSKAADVPMPDTPSANDEKETAIIHSGI